MNTRQNHITSLRLPIDLHSSICEYANAMDRSIADVYRMAIKQFIHATNGGLNG